MKKTDDPLVGAVKRAYRDGDIDEATLELALDAVIHGDCTREQLRDQYGIVVEPPLLEGQDVPY